MGYALAYDVGTSTLKAVLVDAHGNIAGLAKANYDVYMPSEGFAEQIPQDWWNAVAETTREAMEISKVAPDEIDGIVFATQAIGIVPISAEDGKPLCPAIIWTDSRAGDEALELMNLVGGPEAFEQLIGARITGKDAIAKIAWLHRHRPDLTERMDCFLDVNGYLIYRCTGEKVYDISSASGIAYDRETGQMHPEMLQAAGFDPERFPRLVRPNELVGILTKEAADELGLVPGIKVFGGTNDMQATALGSGMSGEGESHFYLGTSGWAAGISSNFSVLSNGGANVCSAEAGKELLFYQPEVACSAFNWALEQFYPREMEELGKEVFAFIEKEVEEVPAGSDYLLFNPWMSGERSPVADNYIRGGFLNIGFSHTRAHMIKAVMEGIAYNLKWANEGLERDMGRKTPTVRIIGGGSQNRAWMQIFADIFDRPVEVVRNTQAAGAIGAAFLVALGIGKYDDYTKVKEWAQVEHVYYPQEENVALYEEMYGEFKESYDSLKAQYYKMNKKRIHE